MHPFHSTEVRTPGRRRRLPAAAVLVAALLGAPAWAQTIEVLSTPAYGADGFLFGKVTGVNPSTHRVACYIHIESFGWWSKFSPGSGTVNIAPDGTFLVDVVTGGVDELATDYYVALLGPGQQAPLALGTGMPAFPFLADAWETRYSREIQFAGRTWGIKRAEFQVGPGENYFSDSPSDVFVDGEGRLHLRVRYSNGAWRCSEIVLKDALGHGTYWFTTETEVEDLDPNLTFGAFTWDVFGDDDSLPAWPYREVDFEDSRWGDPGESTTSQVVVQPYWVPQNIQRYTTPDLSGDPTLTRFFDWQPDKIVWKVATGLHTPCFVPSSVLVHQYSLTDAQTVIPPAGRAQMRFNLWINGGGAPSNHEVAEVIVSDFRFSPDSRVFPTGGDLTILDGLTVASGAPVLGTTMTLGVDDPTGSNVPPGASTLLALGPFASSGFPFGTTLPGFGYGGKDIELLVPLTPTPALVAGSMWNGSPVIFPLAIPFDFGLLGQRVYAQGALFGGSPGIATTNGLELCISFGP